MANNLTGAAFCYRTSSFTEGEWVRGGHLSATRHWGSAARGLPADGQTMLGCPLFQQVLIGVLEHGSVLDI
jgi:hypothetical protein